MWTPKTKLVIAAVFCLLAAWPAEAKPKCDDSRLKWRTSLAHYLESSSAQASAILTQEHCSGEWHLHFWDGSQLDPTTTIGRLETKPSGRAEVTLWRHAKKSGDRANVAGWGSKANKPFRALLVDTNSLVYRTQLTKAADTATLDQEQLQRFVSLLGGFLAATADRSGESERLMIDFGPGGPPTAAIPSGSALEQLGQRLRALDRELERYPIEEPQRLAKAARSELVKLSTLVSEAKRQTDSRLALTQLVELKRWNGSDHVPKEEPTVEVIQESLKTLANAQASLAGAKTPCSEPLSDLEEFLVLAVLPAEPDLTGAREKFADLDAKLISTDCTGAEDLAESIRELAKWFTSTFGPTIGGRAMTQEGRLILDHLPDLQKLNSQIAQVSEIARSAEKALSEKATVGSAVAANQMFLRRYKEIAGDETNPSKLAQIFNHGVLPVDRPEGDRIKFATGKKREEEFKISTSTVFAKNVTLDTDRHPLSTEKYDVVKKGAFVKAQFDFGLIAYTEVDEPEYTEIDATEDGATGKIIALKNDDNRAGETALFVTWIPRSLEKSFFKPGLQLGFGLDAADPAAFAGLALGFGKYVKISGGWTWQQVNELRGDFKPGDPVPANGNYQRDGDAAGAYAAISITLNELSFFKPAK